MAARVHGAFMRNRDLKDEEEIEQHLAKAEYIKKELEALYSLKKYRTMKNRYYSEEKD